MEKNTAQLEKEIINFAGQKNIIINKPALKLLSERPELNYKELIEKLVGENVFVIDEIAIERKIIRTKINTEPEIEIRRTLFRPIAKEINSTFKEIKEFNITGQSNSEGTVQDFTNLFRDKFDFIEKTLHSRQGFSPKPIGKINEITKGREFDFIGMVREKWITKNGNTAFRFEDKEKECIALAIKSKVNIVLLAEKILLDDVVGVKASKGNGDILFINDFLVPDIPQRQPRLAEEQIALALTSDMHIGSKLFLEKQFQKFLAWINGKLDSEKEREIVGRIKYLVIAGDNVDGIGIYPNQINELIIKNIFEQYSTFEKLVQQIPEYIEIMICTPKGTLIKTKKGYVPVEDIKEGDYTYSFDETRQKVVLNKVIGTIRRTAHKLIKLSFSGGLQLNCTPEHPLLVLENGKLIWKKAEELCQGTFLPVPEAYDKDCQLKTIDLLKTMKLETYIRQPQKILAGVSKNGYIGKIPERTRYSYFSGEAPLPFSALEKIGISLQEESFEWPLEIKTHHSKYATLPETLPCEFLYFIGLMLTDGSFSRIKNKYPDGRFGSSCRIRLYNSNKTIIEYAKACLASLGIAPTEEHIEFPKAKELAGHNAKFSKPVHYLSYTNNFLGELIIALGILPGPKQERTIGTLSTLGWDYIKHLLAGLFDGDGTREKKTLRFVSASQRFATELFLLLQEHGFSPNLRKSKIYEIAIYRNQDIKRIYNEVPFLRIKKQTPILNDNISKGILDKKYKETLNLQKDFKVWRKIESTKEISGEEVYNLEVENTHTYLAAGFINHNCPGQHDAVRWADPQPAIPKKFLPNLSEMKNIHLLSSPGWFEIEGLKCMLYHGAALHDLYESLSFLDPAKPQIAMVEVLKRRTLMAPYGLKQPYVPEKKDFLLLRDIPDFYFGGDMHHTGYETYRGTTVMNSSTWQSQTDYQVKQGHIPTPGIVPVVDLKTRQIFEKNFMKEFQ